MSYLYLINQRENLRPNYIEVSTETNLRLSYIKVSTGTNLHLNYIEVSTDYKFMSQLYCRKHRGNYVLLIFN
jgi:hypothetical protein